MKNYYEILEVDVNASPEVIEKAYRTLVKKYHPDLQPDDKKQDAKNKIKMINEAYDTLSTQTKKEQYDNELERLRDIENKKREEEIRKYYQKSNTTQNNHNTYQNDFYNNNYMSKKQIRTPKVQQHPSNKEKKSKQMKNNLYDEQMRKAYNDAYIDALRNMGYEIEYQKTWKDYLRGLLVIIFVIVFCFILWHIPFVKNFILDFYNNNEIIQTFVNSIKQSVS